MRKFTNRAKAILQKGGVAYGGYITIDSPALIETFGACGFDFVMIDVEATGPSPYDSKTLSSLIRACELYDMTSLIRVPENSPTMILKAFTLGAQGVVVAHCKTADDAKQMVRSSLYPPLGCRGVAPSRGLQDIASELPAYIDQANRETLVIPLIEDREGVDNLEAILSVFGIDAIFLGPGDLSASLDHPGEMGHPQVQQYLTRARAICKTKGKCFMDIVHEKAEAEKRVTEGARLLILHDDVSVIHRWLKSQLQQIQDGGTAGLEDTHKERTQQSLRVSEASVAH